RQFADAGMRLLLHRHPSDGLVGRQAVAVETAEQRHRLAHSEFLAQACLLQRDADALADLLVVVPAPAPAEYLDLAGGRIKQAFEDLDCGCLAGPVGAEQPEALARGDLQVEAANGLDWWAPRVRLDELRAADRGVHEEENSD